VVVGQWKALDQPGYLEIDLVSHSGEVAAGRWIYTLCATDLSTGWTERVGIMGNGQAGVLAALEQVRGQLPFPLRGLHPDSGGEFINWQRYAYCQANQIAFSRSRPHHKNDNAHVEQKNWTLVRRLIGYQRRELIHFNVGASPTAAWIWFQLLEATPWDRHPKYLIHDRHAVYGVTSTASWPAWLSPPCAPSRGRRPPTRSPSGSCGRFGPNVSIT
jgi:hypothetical protein